MNSNVFNNNQSWGATDLFRVSLVRLGQGAWRAPGGGEASVPKCFQGKKEADFTSFLTCAVVVI